MSIPRIWTAAQLIEQGRAAAAIPLLEHLTGLFPFYATPFVLRAKAYEAEGDTEAALQAWQQAHFLLPNSAIIEGRLTQTNRALILTDTPLAVQPEAVASQRDFAPLSSTAEAFIDPNLDAIIETFPNPAFTAPEPTDDEPLPEQPRATVEDAPTLEQAIEALEANEHVEASTLADTPVDLDNLDALIAQLEHARIEPSLDPDLLADPLQFADEDPGEMVSETLARIYANQSEYGQAARIYRILAEQQPERAGAFLEKATEMEDLAASQDDAEA